MQYLSRLFFSFDGRIRRADYWIAFVTLGAVSILGSLIIQPDYFTAAVTRPVAQAVLTLVLAVPQLAVCIKRFRDLEWPAWVAYALIGASTAATIAFELEPHHRRNPWQPRALVGSPRTSARRSDPVRLPEGNVPHYRCGARQVAGKLRAEREWPAV